MIHHFQIYKWKKETVYFYFATIFTILNMIQRFIDKNSNDLCGVMKKNGCYQITDACADDVINQSSPKDCSHYQ